ncbi:MFS transporter [Streptomyces sp. NPDC003442]
MPNNANDPPTFQQFPSESPAGATPSTTQVNPQEILDLIGMGKRQWLIVAVCFTAMIVQGLDLASAGFVYPELVREHETTMGIVTLTVTLGGLSMALGGVVAGPLADRFGRKGIAIVGLLVFGTATAGMGLVPSIPAFVALRLLSGAGIGAMVPAVVTMVTESTPTARRASMVSLTWCGGAVGYVLGSFLASAVLPTLGWRALLMICGIPPVLLAPVLAALVPEPVGSLLARGCPTAAVQRSLTRLAPDRDLDAQDLATPTVAQRRQAAGSALVCRAFLPTTLLLWLCSFIGFGVVFLIANYLPLLLDHSGFTTAQSGVAVGLFGICGLVGQLLVSVALWRSDADSLLTLLWAVGGAGLVAVGVLQMGTGGFFGIVLLLGLFLGGSNAILPALATLTYPASARATGTSWANGVGQLGQLASGSLGGLMIGAGWSTPTIFLCLTLPLCGGIAATLALRTGRLHRETAPADDVA